MNSMNETQAHDKMVELLDYFAEHPESLDNAIEFIKAGKQNSEEIVQELCTEEHIGQIVVTTRNPCELYVRLKSIDESGLFIDTDGDGWEEVSPHIPEIHFKKHDGSKTGLCGTDIVIVKFRNGKIRTTDVVNLSWSHSDEHDVGLYDYDIVGYCVVDIKE